LDTESIDELDSQMYDRRCLKHDTVELHGLNFGAETSQLKVWVEGMGFTKEKTIFMVFNGTALTTKMEFDSDILNRGFAGKSDSFSLIHTHGKIYIFFPLYYLLYIFLQTFVRTCSTDIICQFFFLSSFSHSQRPFDSTGTKRVWKRMHTICASC